jgi:hypothetical protein
MPRVPSPPGLSKATALLGSPLPKFGALVGVVAACLCAAAMSPTGALADSTYYWIDIAKEGQSFNQGQSAEVRYGAGDHFITRTVSGNAQCTNDFFGVDPLPNTAKSCYVHRQVEGLASEGQPFATDVPTLVI